MPNYHYACKNPVCETEFEIQQSMKDSPLRLCQACKSESLERVIYAATAFVRGEPKTLGLLADRNTSKMSSMERADKAEADAQHKKAANAAARNELRAKGMNIPEPTEGPKLPPINKKLADLSPKQAQTYIQTGKLP